MNNMVKIIFILCTIGFFIYIGINNFNPLEKTIENFKQDINELRRKNEDYRINYEKISVEYSQAQSLSTIYKKELDEKIQQISKLTNDNNFLNNTIKKLKKQGFNETSASIGQVNIITENIVEGKSTENMQLFLMKKNIFENPWQKTTLLPPDKIKHEYHFKVADVQIELTNKDNNKIYIYSIWLESLTTSEKMYLTYTRDITNIKEEQHLIHWWNPKLSGELLFLSNKGLEGGFSYSLSTFGTSKLSNDTIIIFPSIGFSSNIRDSHHITLGTGINLGYWLPFFSDLYLSPKLIFETSNLKNIGFLISLGTTL